MGGVKPALVVVSGLPATGKSTLARKLAADLRFPLVSKDDYKEILYDGLVSKQGLFGGIAYLTGLGWMRGLGPVSFRLMYKVAERILEAGGSAVMETHFYQTLSSREIRLIAERHPCQVIQVFCYAPLELLIQRDRHRVRNERRHPAHPGVLFSSLKRNPEANHQPLELPGKLIELDTSAFAKIDYPRLLDAVRAALFSPG